MQHEQRSPSDDGSRVEEIARIVLQVLAAERERSPQDKPGLWLRWAEQLRTFWPLVVGAVSLVVVAVAWLSLDVSPLESYHEIARRKDQLAYQRS